MNCPRCGRDEKHGGLVVLCQCKAPLEDEYVLALLNYMVEDIKLLPHEEARITDKTCVAITAYMRGRESGKR